MIYVSYLHVTGAVFDRLARLRRPASVPSGMERERERERGHSLHMPTACEDKCQLQVFAMYVCVHVCMYTFIRTRAGTRMHVLLFV